MKRLPLTMCVVLLALSLSNCNSAQTSQPPVTPATLAAQTLTPSENPTSASPNSLTVTPDATSPSTSATDLADAAFAELLKRVKQSDPNLDFTEFRLTYAKTSDYQPYSFETGDLKKSMFAASREKNYERALELADQILEKNYILPDAHLVASNASRALEQAQRLSFHNYVLNGLLGSILDSGDGKSPETAYVVVLIEEEYAILSLLGIRHSGQSQMDENGHSYDVFEGIDEKTNNPVTVYFNIDLPFQGLIDSMKP